MQQDQQLPRWEPDSAAVLHLVTGPGSPASATDVVRVWVAYCGTVVSARERGARCSVCVTLARRAGGRS